MEIIEDLLQDTGREEFIPVVSEYFERNTGNADYDVELCEDGNLICRSGDRAKLEFFTVNGEVIVDDIGDEAAEIKCSIPSKTNNASSSLNFDKKMWTGKYAIVESYDTSKKQVEAKIYNKATVAKCFESRSEQISNNGTRTLELYPSDFSDLAAIVYQDAYVTVREAGEGTFEFYHKDTDGFTEFYPVDGSSLYDAYYNLMIQLGYFTEGGFRYNR